MVHKRKYLEQLEILCLNCKLHDSCKHNYNCNNKKVINDLINHHTDIMSENEILKQQLKSVIAQSKEAMKIKEKNSLFRRLNQKQRINM